jgi:hypothetical protein
MPIKRKLNDSKGGAALNNRIAIRNKMLWWGLILTKRWPIQVGYIYGYWGFIKAHFLIPPRAGGRRAGSARRTPFFLSGASLEVGTRLCDSVWSP